MKASRVNQILLLFFIFCFVESRPHRKDWSSLNFELLEEEWKKGDDPQELATLDDELYEAYEKHQKRMKHELRSNKKIDPLHMAEIENAGKPAMIFATLSKDTKQKWDWDELSDICIGWADRLQFLGIQIKCYPIVPDRIMVTLQRTWRGQDVYEFLSHEDNLEEIRWNKYVVKPKKIRMELES